jgi:hypothetical protein
VFLPIFDRVSALVAATTPQSAAAHHQLLASALLCAASTCQALAVQALPKLPTLLSSLLDVLTSFRDLEDPAPAQAALYATTAVCGALPSFLSPFLPRLLPALLQSRVAGLEGGVPLHRAMTVLATFTPGRIILPGLFAAYPHAVAQGPDMVVLLIEAVTRALEATKTETLVKLTQTGPFYLHALDYRRNSDKVRTTSRRVMLVACARR